MSVYLPFPVTPVAFFLDYLDFFFFLPRSILSCTYLIDLSVAGARVVGTCSSHLLGAGAARR